MAELADALDLGSSEVTRAGSSPVMSSHDTNVRSQEVILI